MADASHHSGMPGAASPRLAAKAANPERRARVCRVPGSSHGSRANGNGPDRAARRAPGGGRDRGRRDGGLAPAGGGDRARAREPDGRRLEQLDPGQQARLEQLLARRCRARADRLHPGREGVLEPAVPGRPGGADPAARDRDRGRSGAGADLGPPRAAAASSTSAPAPAVCCSRCCRSCRTPPGSASIFSAEALALAQVNAVRLDLAERAALRAGDWGRGLAPPFDLIVGNPPYVGRSRPRRPEPEVRDFEPRAALIAGPDGLDAYRAFAPTVPACWRQAAAPRLRSARAKARRSPGFSRAGLEVIERRRDLAGVVRCLVARPAEHANR